jgi:hypothetical protein
VEPTTPTPEPVIDGTPTRSDEAPTVALTTGLLPAMSPHCTRCGADLAPDQRYCVVCGERRGEPRLPFMDGRTAARPAVVETVTTTTSTAPPAPPRSRWSSGATLIAGVGTLLLALGVGVLIGNAGKDDNGSAAAAAPQVITVNGAAAAATDTTATTATTAGSSETKAKDKGAKDAKRARADTTAKTATTVVTTPGGGSVPQAAAAPVVKKGQKGSGPGYEDGKFTGNFFGN